MSEGSISKKEKNLTPQRRHKEKEKEEEEVDYLYELIRIPKIISNRRAGPLDHSRMKYRGRKQSFCAVIYIRCLCAV
jgi:hypothetical protein